MLASSAAVSRIAGGRLVVREHPRVRGRVAQPGHRVDDPVAVPGREQVLGEEVAVQQHPTRGGRCQPLHQPAGGRQQPLGLSGAVGLAAGTPFVGQVRSYLAFVVGEAARQLAERVLRQWRAVQGREDVGRGTGVARRQRRAGDEPLEQQRAGAEVGVQQPDRDLRRRPGAQRGGLVRRVTSRGTHLEHGRETAGTTDGVHVRPVPAGQRLAHLERPASDGDLAGGRAHRGLTTIRMTQFFRPLGRTYSKPIRS